LEQYDRAMVQGLRFDWLTFDEGYGGKPEFLRELSARKQSWVAEVPKSVCGWVKPPRVTERPHRTKRRGRRWHRLEGVRPCSGACRIDFSTFGRGLPDGGA